MAAANTKAVGGCRDAELRRPAAVQWNIAGPRTIRDGAGARGILQWTAAQPAGYSNCSAFSITTASAGTSRWPPRVVVFTAAMAWTVSMPSTTLPNTA